MKKSITRDEWSMLILFLAILLGTFLRFNPTMLAGFAVNDGGMFSVMMDDLRANRYLIPAFTTYNQSNIPFAYPPLGFYFGALAVDLFKFDSIQVVRWLPALFASLSIPAFYFLAFKLFKNKFHASLAALFFALMPRAFFWSVMGGGLTRATGQFFMLLALAVVVRLYEENRRADIFVAGVLAGLAVLSHPEAAVHTFISAALILIMLFRKRATLMQSLLVGMIVIFVATPWWGTVIRYHGIDPLLNATRTGGNAMSIFHLVFLVFAEEPYATFITVLGVIGLMHRFTRRDYLFPLWILLPFLIAGRSAASLAAIPLAMLASIGLAEVVFPALQVSGREEAGISPVERNITLYLILYLVFAAYQFGFQLSGASLNKSDLDAMNWVEANVPVESKFVVLTGSTSVACDYVAEWFPALTDRQSLHTIQGTEWTLGDEFREFVAQASDVQACVNDASSCLAEKTRSNDYVFAEKRLSVNNCVPLEFAKDFKYFIEQMRADERFESVYENDGVVIFAVR